MREFSVGDSYRPIVRIAKVKNEVPTVLTVSGRRYILEYRNPYRPNQKQPKGDIIKNEKTN